MLKPETVGAVIALYTEDRDDFDAETIRGIIENAYNLMNEKKHVSIKLDSIKRILEEFISQGYIQKARAQKTNSTTLAPATEKSDNAKTVQTKIIH